MFNLNLSSIISYLSAKVVPLVNSLTGVSMVLVTPISLMEGSLVPHSPQNFRMSGLSALHFGHLVATFSPLSGRKKDIKECI